MKAELRDKREEMRAEAKAVLGPYHRDGASIQQTGGNRKQTAYSRQQTEDRSQKPADSEVSYRQGEPALSRALPGVSEHECNTFRSTKIKK